MTGRVVTLTLTLTLTLIAGTDARSVRLFDAETGMCMLVLIGHTDGVSELIY